jgi:transcriptional regulator with XRE-family HTH domain
VKLGRALKMDAPRVSQMEAGLMLPTADELRVIADLLGCAATELYPPRWLKAILEEANDTAAQGDRV